MSFPTPQERGRKLWQTMIEHPWENPWTGATYTTQCEFVAILDGYPNGARETQNDSIMLGLFIALWLQAGGLGD